MKRALVYLDPAAVTDSLDLVDVASRMYGPDGCAIYGLCVGASEEAGHGVVDHLIRVDDDRIARHDIVNITNCIEELQDEYRFDAILVPATTFGRMLAPRAAMRLHVGLVADVTAVRCREDRIELVRPAFSGRMLASIVNRGRVPVMMSVRQNVFTHEPRHTRETRIVDFVPQRVRNSGVRLVERQKKTEAIDIRGSDVLVAGGGGVLRHFGRLEALAEELHGMVAASRRVVDSGVAPRHIQVGQSGKTVSPRLYIALGISGSIQHVVGLKKAEYVISVNSNRHAPICSLSDIVVEGDAREFIERMVERIGRGGPVPPDSRDTIHNLRNDGGIA